MGEMLVVSFFIGKKFICSLLIDCFKVYVVFDCFYNGNDELSIVY